MSVNTYHLKLSITGRGHSPVEAIRDYFFKLGIGFIPDGVYRDDVVYIDELAELFEIEAIEDSEGNIMRI